MAAEETILDKPIALDETLARVAAALEARNDNIGNISALTTTDKSSLVAAVNEVNSKSTEAVAKCECLVLTKSAVSSLPTTISSLDVETDMVCINATLSNPSAQISDWTVNTNTAGACTISGSISGTTDITLYLMKSR